MQNRRTILLWLALAWGAIGAPGKNAEALEANTEVALHAALKRHLDLRQTDGQYHVKNTKTSSWMILRLKRVRPEVYGKGSAFLMSADFVDRQGKTVVVDFILAKKRAGYSVVKRFVGERAQLLRALRSTS